MNGSKDSESGPGTPPRSSPALSGSGDPETLERTVVLTAGAEAPASARDFANGLDLGLDAEAADQVELMVSEVVTNSVLHAGLATGDPIELSIRSLPDRVRVEVGDWGSGFESRERPRTGGLIGGWGLVIVDRLASRWGTTEGPRFGVWFELDR